MEPVHSPIYQPLWAALNDVQMPIHFHAFPDLSRGAFKRWDDNRGANFTLGVNFTLSLADILVELTGRGWIPYVLDRMDYEYDQIGKNFGLKMKPSDYYKKKALQNDVPTARRSRCVTLSASGL